MSDDAKSSSGLSFPQIAGGALAAATAAILGSFLGVLGTIGGAAVASIVSTVGAALYQRSLERTTDRVKERLVVGGTAQQKVAGAVARVTGTVPAKSPEALRRQAAGQTQVQQQVQQQVGQQPLQRPGGPGRAPTGPGGRGPAPGPVAPGARPGTPPRPGGPPGPPGRPTGPGDRPLRGGGRTVSTQVFSQDPATRLQTGAVSPAGPRIPTARVPGTPPGGVPPTARFGQGGLTRGGFGPEEPDAPTMLTSTEPPARRRIGKRGWLVMAGLGVSIFAIGLLASFGVETAAGHPLSGGSGGTSVGSLFGQDTGTPTTTSQAPSTSDSSSDQGSSTTTTRQDGGSDSTRSGSPTTSRSSRQQDQQQDQQGQTTQRQLIPSNLVPQLGGGSGSNG